MITVLEVAAVIVCILLPLVPAKKVANN